MISILAAVASVAVASAPAAAAPAPLTLEQKAGCGVALTFLEEGVTQLPNALSSVAADEKPMVKMLVRTMGDQGRQLMAEAFAEGASRQLSPLQVYQLGVRDLFVTLGPIDFSDTGTAGEAILKQFMNRCIS